VGALRSMGFGFAVLAAWVVGAAQSLAQGIDSNVKIENVGGEAILVPTALPSECELDSVPDESESAHLVRISDCLLPKQAALALVMARMAGASATTPAETEAAKKGEEAAHARTARLVLDQPQAVATRKIVVNGAQFDASRHYAVRMEDGVAQIKMTGESFRKDFNPGKTVRLTRPGRDRLNRDSTDDFAIISQRTMAQSTRVQDGVSVPVYFATNRALSADKTDFGGDGAALSYGRHQVAMPTNDAKSLLDKLVDAVGLPSTAETARITNLEELPTEAFRDALCKTWPAGREKRLLFFVHGFNNAHKDAVLTAADLARKLMFDGKILLFSWPSQGDLLKYRVDEQMEDLSERSFRSVLTYLHENCKGVGIHVVAHSMGNRLLLAGLEELTSRGASPNVGPFVEFISAAPDVGHKAYAARVSKSVTAVKRVTLYASSSDSALWISAHVYNPKEGKRAGQCDDQFIVTAPGLDSIDASAAGGNHWFYMRELAAADFAFVLGGAKTERPPRSIRPRTALNASYWALE
jgi:esterase/lipase superfamily enzyme